MNRRDLLAAGAGLTLTEFSFCLASSLQVSGERHRASGQGTVRHPVFVRSGFTRKLNGADDRAPSPSGMFDTEVVRSSDSEGRLAVFVFPAGDHHPYQGAPLHVHHEQDEWIYVMAGEFVAEVGGERMRLKPGDSLLMPMKVPHRWSVAQDSHCGAIHLYTPAGLMETQWASVAQSEDPKNQEARKAEFERHGLTLLGGALSKEEIDRTL
ncbi:MAG: cupin domain-containing protein [Acidobacteriia bacterium]|nr:cupin domain-containing protein [Terriglobia bacterium]